ncbi:MAG: EAL domain-containing protein [Pseudomonadota bacterium]
MNSHLVQFYEDDGFLIQVLADYIGDALERGNQGIVIATRSHLDRLHRKLGERAPPASGRAGAAPFIALEADRMLPLFMENGLPDRARFYRAIGDVIARAADAHAGHVQVFGEMVALLCGAGACGLGPGPRHAAAIQVERFFNELLKTHDFSLLCAYPLSAFRRSGDRGSFDHVCRLHSEVLPAESYDPKTSLHSLRRAIASLQQQAYSLATEVHDRKQVEQALREVNFDRLTGLPNRGVFHDRLEVDLNKARRAGLPVALLFIDLDHFKEINDTLGHAVGDMLLQQVGQRLSSYVRKCDSVTRLGGDEFTLTMSEVRDIDGVTDMAQKILHDLAAPFHLGGHVAYISASIGITLFPQDGASVGELLRNADQAMYQAKDLGRNRFCYFTHSMQEAAQSRMALSNELRRALEQQQLEVYYQPIVELASARVVKAEALLRWRHPENGEISPTDFIPIAEHTGMIVPIGDWVFHQALQQARRWRERDPQFTVSVNISPAQFSRNNEAQYRQWLAHCAALAAPAGDAGPAVGLEITEGLLLRADGGVMRQLAAFREAGIELSLDDFGTGYSSLSYLRKFKLNYLKIDKSFVYNLEHDSANVALCEAIIVMAHKLGLKVIAEGVETAHQCALLREAGCDYGQGFLFAHPMPVREFEALLERGAAHHAAGAA